MAPSVRMPPMLYGTAWKGPRTSSLVVQAVLSGFKGIDTACQPKHYSQSEVGDALAQLHEKHNIERGELWLQTKFTTIEGQDSSKPLPYHRDAPLVEQVRQSLVTSLNELNTTYLDALVLHSPMGTKKDHLAVWGQLEEFVEAGKVRQLGISNIYDPVYLAWIFETSRIKPTIIQNRFCAEGLNYCLPILELCAEHGAKFQSFWTLTANPQLLASPAIQSLAGLQSLSREAALYKFLMTSSRFGTPGLIVPLNGTTDGEHMKEGVKVTQEVESELAHGGKRVDERKRLERELERMIWR
ncbi:hypothetical protein JCM1841_003595 [Sporobolomyces salmonicolor]